MALPQDLFPKTFPPVPAPDASTINVPPGYRAHVLAFNLDYPTAITFDNQGQIYVSLAGYVYGDPVASPRVIRIDTNGNVTVISENFNAPINDILWDNGILYVSHRGAISAIANGTQRTLVDGLPAFGDHHNNQLSIGPDGKLYVGVGVATDSGIIGLDNAFPFLHLLQRDDIHDVPSRDLKLRGKSYYTPNPNNVLAQQTTLTTIPRVLTAFVASVLNPTKRDTLLVRTGAYQPFGHNSTRSLKGEVKSNGTILSFNKDGSGLTVHSDGYRNPFGVRWYKGQLYVVDLGMDNRGSRPVQNAPDVIWKANQGTWHGFPDFVAGIPITDKRFQVSGTPRLTFLLKDHPAVEQPWVVLPPHSSPTKFDFSRSANFGFIDQLFTSFVGPAIPVTGSSSEIDETFKVARIDPANPTPQAFLSNKPSAQGPKGFENYATKGLRSPVDCRFGPDGNLYVVDIGSFFFGPSSAGPLAHPAPGSGVIWKVIRA